MLIIKCWLSIFTIYHRFTGSLRIEIDSTSTKKSKSQELPYSNRMSCSWVSEQTNIVFTLSYGWGAVTTCRSSITSPLNCIELLSPRQKRMNLRITLALILMASQNDTQTQTGTRTGADYLLKLTKIFELKLGPKLKLKFKLKSRKNCKAKLEISNWNWNSIWIWK